MVQRFHNEMQPATQTEFDLVNDVARAYWLMNYWKIRTNNSRRELKTLKKTDPQSLKLAELEKERAHHQWHWIKQQLFLARRKKQFEECRAQYEQELAESGYTIDEAREYFLAHFTGGQSAAAEDVDIAVDLAEAA